MELKLNLSHVISRVVIVLLLGVAFGVFMNRDFKEDYKKGEELTLEEYTAGYAAYKEDLMDNSSPVILDIAIGLFFAGFIFACYETIAWLLALGITFIYNKQNQHEEIQKPW